ncbi:unnamed protein product [Closterium sp. NIES-65]|nr:unnamed protein product [Closterium sp. NIES-65]
MAIGALFNAAFPSPPFDEGAIAFVPPQADYAWRVVLAAGAVPAKLTFYFRMTMLETPRFTTLVQRNAKQAARDMGQMFHSAFEEAEVEIELATAPVRTYSLLSREFLHHHGVHLLATAACWFLVDTAYYSQNLLNRDLFTAIGWVAPPYSMNALTEMYELSKDTATRKEGGAVHVPPVRRDRRRSMAGAGPGQGRGRAERGGDGAARGGDGAGGGGVGVGKGPRGAWKGGDSPLGPATGLRRGGDEAAGGGDGADRGGDGASKGPRGAWKGGDGPLGAATGPRRGGDEAAKGPPGAWKGGDGPLGTATGPRRGGDEAAKGPRGAWKGGDGPLGAATGP